MQFTDYYAAHLGLPVSDIVQRTLFAFDGEVYSILKWDASLGAEPTSEQLAEIASMPEPARVPDEVTDLQFRLALNAEGLRDIAESYVAAAAWDVRDWWDRATHIRRDDARLNAAVVAIGKTDADRDALFTLAATL